ncbi:MAG: 4-hydroxythreonine-4-phosphate dehydrogenase PdxA [Myxococcota bacterium]
MGSKTRIGITVGDAAGIGPEVILKALRDEHDYEVVIFGTLASLEMADVMLGETQEDWQAMRPRIEMVETPASELDDDSIGVYEVPTERDASTIVWGERSAAGAELQLAAFESAIAAARDGHIDAICTAPWTKELFRLIDEPPVGHTEILAEAFDAPDHVMMLAGPRLRVALVTVHVPISEVSERLTPERLSDTIQTVSSELRERFDIDEPSLAVCGLNPHAGEHGVMGTEEAEVIEPTLDRLRDELEHTTIDGPLPADTLFARYRGDAQPWDAVICMYHDQGLIPLKLAHFGESANLTLGLPIVRTSVDHGTAYDIAGDGVADAGSMRYALKMASELAR